MDVTLASVHCLLLMLAWGTASALSAQGFEVTDAATSLNNGVYYVDAEVEINFSEESTQALQSGVALTVRYEMEVRRIRRWLWDPPVARLASRYQLARHALSKQYVVRNLNLGTTQSFPTMQAAKIGLGRISRFPLVDRTLLDGQFDYRWRMRARLDIGALPAPLRPLAYLSNLWHHDSEWHEWPLTR